MSAKGKERPDLQGSGYPADWVCPPHFWIIDSANYGRCRYCPAEKDFSKLLARHQRRMDGEHQARAVTASAVAREGGLKKTKGRRR